MSMILSALVGPSDKFNLPSGFALLQSSVVVLPEHGGKFLTGIYPHPDSATWYYGTPGGEVWINGLDGKKNADGCLLLFDTEEQAEAHLEKLANSHAQSHRWAIFSTSVSDDLDLIINLHTEYHAYEPA